MTKHKKIKYRVKSFLCGANKGDLVDGIVLFQNTGDEDALIYLPPERGEDGCIVHCHRESPGIWAEVDKNAWLNLDKGDNEVVRYLIGGHFKSSILRVSLAEHQDEILDILENDYLSGFRTEITDGDILRKKVLAAIDIEKFNDIIPKYLSDDGSLVALTHKKQEEIWNSIKRKDIK